MKFLFIVLTIRLLARVLFGNKEDDTNEVEAGNDLFVRHPAEYMLR